MIEVFAVLMCGFIATTASYWWLLREAEKRIVHLQHQLDECRRAEQRYAAALMKARTP